MNRTATKLGLLATLYFSQGLPFGFFTQALPVMLREQGMSLGKIGLASLLAAPWALKFLWAPLVDRYGSERWGRRKSWIVPLQLCAVVVLTILATLYKPGATGLLMGAVFVLNFVAATQDIATDGLAVDMLDRKERGFANGIQVAGYRIGMILGGGVLLIWHETIGSAATFLAMAGMTLVATIPVLLSAEPEPTRMPSVKPGNPRHFLRRAGTPTILLLIATYKAGDAFATGMLRPYLVDTGLSMADVGWLLGTAGFVAGLVGALVGGALVERAGRRPALVGFGVVQAIAVAGYAWIAALEPDLSTLYAVCAFEHFAGGMATAALFTCMMDWCSGESNATDYTVQASTVVIATGAAAAVAGFSAQALGYVAHFGLAAGLSLAAVAVAYVLFPSASYGAPVSD